MSQSLLTFAEVMALLPDNTTRLISPADVRSAVLSVTPDRGVVREDTPFTVPITTANVYVPIEASAPSAELKGELFWTKRPAPDNRLEWNYDADAIIDINHQRAAYIGALVDYDPLNNVPFEFGLTVDGVVVSSALLDWSQGTDKAQVTLRALETLTVADKPRIGVSVRNTAGTQDLAVNDFVLWAFGYIM